MIPDEEPTVQPLDSSKLINDDVEKEKTLQKKITTFDTPNNNSHSIKNNLSTKGNQNP